MFIFVIAGGVNLRGNLLTLNLPKKTSGSKQESRVNYNSIIHPLSLRIMETTARSPLIRPVGAPSPARGEGSPQGSIALDNQAYFMAFNFIFIGRCS